jgi:cell division protein ZapA (FtsZ GTPase activity inhibitor)
MNELPATLYILDRPYKLKVRPDDEHFLRKAAETIDSQARSYGKMYAYNDRQDLLAMVALTQITQLLELQDRLQYKDTKLASRLTDINELLDTKVVL